MYRWPLWSVLGEGVEQGTGYGNSTHEGEQHAQVLQREHGVELSKVAEANHAEGRS